VNNLQKSYIKWIKDCYMMPLLFQTALINNMTGATARVKKQEQSASIHCLKITKEAAKRLLEREKKDENINS